MITQFDRASPQWKALTCPSTLILVAILALGLIGTHWFKLNVWASVPRGVYRMQARTALDYGMLVTLAPPVAIHPWWPWWVDLLKPIAGLPGDTVCILDEGLWVRGEPYGDVLRDGHGKPLPRLRGCFVVQAGEVFLATKTVGTIDGRYYGAVPVSALKAQAIPVWIWR